MKRVQDRSMRSGCVLVTMALVCASGEVRAVDGVVEINQARALAGGVSAGDAPGFPVTINQSGSYRLTGNLTKSSGSNDDPAIDITSIDVRLDLNGFAIRGPNGQGTGVGIRSSADNTHVLDGTVRSFGGGGLDLGTGAVVRQVQALDNAGNGISVGDQSRIDACRAAGNQGTGIDVDSDTIVARSIAAGNTVNGIRGADAVVVVSSVAANNPAFGILLDYGSVVWGNAARANETGVSSTTGVIIANSEYASTLRGMSLAVSGYAFNGLFPAVGAQQSVAGGEQLAPNVCDGTGSLCP